MVVRELAAEHAGCRVSRQPPTLAQAAYQGLLTDEKQGILTFSNGSHWEGWASHNCLECRWWDVDEGGKFCAFEAAAFLGIVSPELARLFGWVRDDHEAAIDAAFRGVPDDPRQWWEEPALCPFLKHRDDDSPDPPFIDPNQLTFLTPEYWPETRAGEERITAVEHVEVHG